MEQVSFVSLADIHKDLKELFLQQQEALLDGDLTRAGNRLEEFEGRLLRHIRDEEEFLLPVYERAGAIPGGPPVLFTGEHKRWNTTIGAKRLSSTPPSIGCPRSRSDTKSWPAAAPNAAKPL